MSTSTRRARERANTRERIIEAALHVLETEGIAALTIRRIATDVEHSAPVVHQHFANKDALVLELVAHGHRLMLTGFRHAAQEPDTDRRLMHIASEYVRFAGEHPHLYQVMNDPAVDADARRHVVKPAIDVLKELLANWAAEHGVVLSDPDEACEILWGTLYGIASLVTSATIEPATSPNRPSARSSSAGGPKVRRAGPRCNVNPHGLSRRVAIATAAEQGTRRSTKRFCASSAPSAARSG